MISLYHHHPQPLPAWMLVFILVSIFAAVGFTVHALIEINKPK